MNFLLALVCFFSASFIQAQQLEPALHYYQAQEVYLVPQTVYVGDRGRLVVSLGSAFIDAQSFILETREDLPVNLFLMDDIVIQRIELERRGSNIRLFIDFVSFAPGVFILPPIAIPSSTSESLMLFNIEFTIASILTPDTMVLSPLALPLTVPGTGLMVYGGLGALLLCLILGSFFIIRFSHIINPLKRKWKQRRFLVSLEKKIQLLREHKAGVGQQKRDETFSALAAEFREFLSFITGLDCCVLTPYEFTLLSVAIPGTPSPGFFHELFKSWDIMRFSGRSLRQDDILQITDELEKFFSGFLKAERES